MTNEIANIKSAFLAPEDYTTNLIAELKSVGPVFDRLVTSTIKNQTPAWCHNIWQDPKIFTFESIGDAAKILRGMGRNWSLYPYKEFRRAKLIEEKLPHISYKPFKFGSPLPKAPLGSWTLLDKNTILASAECSSPFPNGEITFDEDKTGPPNRAYLKLWEAFTHIQNFPKKGQRVLDAGASPGGWTWVLQNLGAEVLAVDRAVLDPSISRLSGIEFKKGVALSFTPEDLGEFDWIFSDVICYPDKLLEWLTPWLESGASKNFICTLKFQGSSHYSTIDKFRALPNSQLLHLSVNKHELTWIKQNKES